MGDGGNPHSHINSFIVAIVIARSTLTVHLCERANKKDDDDDDEGSLGRFLTVP